MGYVRIIQTTVVLGRMQMKPYCTPPPPLPHPPVMLETEAILAQNGPLTKYLDRPWGINPCNPFSNLLPFNESLELIQSCPIQVLSKPQIDVQTWCQSRKLFYCYLRVELLFYCLKAIASPVITLVNVSLNLALDWNSIVTHTTL